MPTATIPVKDEVVEIPIPKKSMFILYFRQGMNPHSLFTLFFADGNFQQVVQRAKSHCERMNYRFVTVKPAITDFELDEKKAGVSDNI